MIEKSHNANLYEMADMLIDEFRGAVRMAQQNARDSGVDYIFIVNGTRYTACPNGDIEKTPNGGQ